MSRHHFDEFVLMDNVYEMMRVSGETVNVIRVSFDEKSLEDWQFKYPKVTLDDLHKVVKICIANGWLEHSTLGGGFNNLKPTTTGVGVAKSRYMLKATDKTVWQKAKGWCNDNQGLLAVAGIVVAAILGIITIM
jgi:hypothetical protein